MKKLILISSLLFNLNANNFVQVDCTEMSKVIELLQGYKTMCQIDTTTHLFTQRVSENKPGVIQYEDSGEEVPFETVANSFSVNIEVNRPFVYKINNFVSIRHKLTLLADGTESWKYFYLKTKRWRNYNFSYIGIDTIELESRIVYEDHTAAKDVLVQTVSDFRIHESVTDINGTFIINRPPTTSFYLRAWNELSEPPEWAVYVNKLRVTEGKLEEEIDGNWVDLDKDVMVSKE